MKLKIMLSVMLALMLSAGFNQANAAPWRGGYHGYFRPAVRFAPAVRVYVPPAPFVVGGYYGPQYCRPAFTPRYYGYRHCR